MTKLRITLVSASVRREEELPGFEHVRDFASHAYNVAVLSLKAAALAEADLGGRIAVEVLDLPVTQARSELGEAAAEAVLERGGPDVLGLSCYCWSVDALLELGARVAARRPGVFVVAGGPSAGPVAAELLAEHPWLDAVAASEGERTFVELLRALLGGGDLAIVPGLWHRDGAGSPVASHEERAEVDLSALPSPYRSGAVEAVPEALLLETSRGCRFRCRFCSWATGPGRPRTRPIESVEADLRWAVERGVTEVRLADSTINFDTDRLRELAAATGRADPERRLRLSYFVKAEALTAEQVALLRSIPTDELIVGVESLDDGVRRGMGKPSLDPGGFEALLGGLAEVGRTTISLIMGLPGDDAEGLARTLDWAVGLDARHPGWINEICLFWLAVLPGSRLHAEARERGLRVMPRGIPYLLESREHSPDDLLAMARLAALRHYGHPALRIERFHKAYLAEDAAGGGAGPSLPRVVGDDRPAALIAGSAAASTAFGPGPGESLEAASMKAYAEADDRARRSFRIELTHLRCRGGAPAAGEVDALQRLAERGRPRLVVLSCEALEEPAGPLRAVRKALPDATVLVAGLSVPAGEVGRLVGPGLADGAIVGDGEGPLCEALRRGGVLDGVAGLLRPGAQSPPDPSETAVEDLDETPSPFQWGLLRAAGPDVAMRLSRPRPGGGPARVHGAARVHGDLRWAIEQWCRHVAWLDPALPVDGDAVRAFVGAARRADPTGRLRHSYSLGDEEPGPRALEQLSALPAGGFRAPVGWGAGGAARRLAEASGGRLVAAGRRVDEGRLLALLEPWKRRPALSGWGVDGLAGPAAEGEVVTLGFAHEGGGRATVGVAVAPDGQPACRVEASDPAPRDEDLVRLRDLVERWLARGAGFLLG